LSSSAVASPAHVPLPVPPEPAGLRQELRAAQLEAVAEPQTAAEAGSRERLDLEFGVCEALWPAWGAALSERGLTRDAFAAAVGGYRRELWFWLLGDRLWAQVATGLAGRLLRRLPPS